MPFLATSIIPDDENAPTIIPRLATIMMVLMVPALEPMAEFRKLTASLLTPTIKSNIASVNKTTTTIRKNPLNV